MSIISLDKYKKLADYQHPTCISIYIPTHRSGKEVLENQDAIQLKNRIQQAGRMLEEQGISKEESQKMLKPLQNLLDDKNFWHYRSDGTVFFLSPERFEYFTVPIAFEPFTFVNNHFYLKPLTPLFSGDERFFILAISQNQVRFYEATRYSLSDVKIEDLVPANLEEAIGHDYEQKSLQFRSGQNNAAKGANFHGQGRSGGEVEKKEMEKFLRAVDDGLMEMLHDEKPPIIIAAVDRVATEYRNVSRYHHILDKNISGNPDHADPLVLHKEAIALLQKDYLSKEKEEKHTQYASMKTAGKASAQTEEIIHKAINGGVDALFIQKGKSEMYGIYMDEMGKIRIDSELTDQNNPLIDLAIRNTLTKNGAAYLVDEEEMPEKEETMCAIFRY